MSAPLEPAPLARLEIHEGPQAAGLGAGEGVEENYRTNCARKNYSVRCPSARGSFQVAVSRPVVQPPEWILASANSESVSSALTADFLGSPKGIPSTRVRAPAKNRTCAVGRLLVGQRRGLLGGGSRAALGVRIFSARCLGVQVSREAKRG